MRLPFRSRLALPATALFALALSTLALGPAAPPAAAMDSDLESFPVSVREDLDVAYDYDVHAFALDEPALVTAVVVADGFHPTLRIIPGDERDSVALAGGAAGEPVQVTAWLDAGSYRLVVVGEPVWDEEASYTLAVDRLAAGDLGPARRVEPAAGAAGGFRFADPLPVLGARLPPAVVGAETTVVTLSGGSEAELLLVDAEGLLLHRDARSVSPRPGSAGVVVAGPFVDATVTVQAAAAGGPAAPEQRFSGTLDASSPPALERIPLADLHRVDVPSSLAVRIEARSPAIYLDLTALDAAGGVVAAAEEGDEGFVALDLPEGHAAVAAIVVSGRGDTGPYALTVRAETPLALGGGDALALTAGRRQVAAGAAHRLTLPSAGTLRATSPAGAQILALAADGRWLGASRPLAAAESLEVGQRMRVADEVAADADATVEGQPELRQGEVVEIEQLSGDGVVAMVGRDGHSWAVFTAGLVPLEASTGRSQLELAAPAGDVQLLVLGNPAGLTVEHVASLLDMQEEAIEEGDTAERLGTDRSARHALMVGAGELVELALTAPALAGGRLRLLDGEGAELSSGAPAADGAATLAWLSDRSRAVQVEVVGPAEGEAPYEVTVRRRQARLTSHQVALADGEPLRLREPREAFVRSAAVDLPAGTPVLVRLQAPEAGRLDLALLDAAGNPLAVASSADTGAAEASLVASIPPGGGRVTVVVGTELEPGELDVEVTPLERAPELAHPAASAAQPRERKAAPDFRWADEGGERSLSDLRGQVVVLEFWASWCGPCRDTLPRVEALHRRYADRGLVVLGVNDEPREVAAAAAAEMGLSFPTLPDEDAAIGGLYGVDSIPRTVVVGSDGSIVADFDGAAEEGRLLRAVLAALGAAAG